MRFLVTIKNSFNNKIEISKVFKVYILKLFTRYNIERILYSNNRVGEFIFIWDEYYLYYTSMVSKSKKDLIKISAIIELYELKWYNTIKSRPFHDFKHIQAPLRFDIQVYLDINNYLECLEIVDKYDINVNLYLKYFITNKCFINKYDKKEKKITAFFIKRNFGCFNEEKYKYIGYYRYIGLYHLEKKWLLHRIRIELIKVDTLFTICYPYYYLTTELLLSLYAKTINDSKYIIWGNILLDYDYKTARVYFYYCPHDWILDFFGLDQKRPLLFMVKQVQGMEGIHLKDDGGYHLEGSHRKTFGYLDAGRWFDPLITIKEFKNKHPDKIKKEYIPEDICFVFKGYDIDSIDIEAFYGIDSSYYFKITNEIISSLNFNNFEKLSDKEIEFRNNKRF